MLQANLVHFYKYYGIFFYLFASVGNNTAKKAQKYKNRLTKPTGRCYHFKLRRGVLCPNAVGIGRAQIFNKREEENYANL